MLRSPNSAGRVAEWNIELQAFQLEFSTTRVIKGAVLADFVAEWAEALGLRDNEDRSLSRGSEAPEGWCRISGSGRPLRFEHWGARGDYALNLSVSQGTSLLQETCKRHKIYTGSDHRCGVIPYSSVWCGGLPLGLMMNSTEQE